VAYSIQHIASLMSADAHLPQRADIAHLLIDSRRIVFPEQSLFFALDGPRRSGHQFIAEVYSRGVRNFVAQKNFDHARFADANFLLVDDVLASLQTLAAAHRKEFSIPVIGITGSNGKTIVKEWLYQLLQDDYRIIRSPRSYNSQVGVPLSVWQMNSSHTLAIFEAGISTVNEMAPLEKIIRPTIGIFTNLSSAHSEGFADERTKALEKIKLFAHCDMIIYNLDSLEATIEPAGKDRTMFPAAAKFFSWSRSRAADLHILQEQREEKSTIVTAQVMSRKEVFTIPFTDRISIDNAVTCICVMLQFGYTAGRINERLALLQPVDMRMQLIRGINNCYLLNDSYSNDLASLSLALDYLQQQAGDHPATLILSDILQSGRPDHELYAQVAAELRARGIKKLIGIGSAISNNVESFRSSGIDADMYVSTDALLHQAGTQQFRDEYILLKGARVFEFERITAWLEQQVHQTVMEINLSAMAHNLKNYQQQLQPATKLMAMVKAFSYGSGSAEVARVLQFHKVDYLAVAYADEGVDLRKAGISLPIMVMNADDAGFDALVTYNLEPEIYSFDIYRAFDKYLSQQGISEFPVHIKFNTGMNRLGFEVAEAGIIGGLINDNKTMAVRTVFSHLAASEAPEHDAFTARQVADFKTACGELKAALGYDFIRHIANSAAIWRKPEYQFELVRLGIGLYGVDSAADPRFSLETVTALYSTIAQVRRVAAGESVGYSRKGITTRDSIIATVRIGYADGFSRRLGNGAGQMFVRGLLAPVIGSVCMDMTMIDVTDIAGVTAGDRVEVFGRNLPVQQVAEWAGTIAYEVLTGISQRVKRIYLEE
jgi:alanine racemase